MFSEAAVPDRQVLSPRADVALLTLQLRSLLKEVAAAEADPGEADRQQVVEQMRSRLARLVADRRSSLDSELASVRASAVATIAAAHGEASSIVSRSWSTPGVSSPGPAVPAAAEAPAARPASEAGGAEPELVHAALPVDAPPVDGTLVADAAPSAGPYEAPADELAVDDVLSPADERWLLDELWLLEPATEVDRPTGLDGARPVDEAPPGDDALEAPASPLEDSGDEAVDGATVGSIALRLHAALADAASVAAEQAAASSTIAAAWTAGVGTPPSEQPWPPADEPSGEPAPAASAEIGDLARQLASALDDTAAQAAAHASASLTVAQSWSGAGAGGPAADEPAPADLAVLPPVDVSALANRLRVALDGVAATAAAHAAAAGTIARRWSTFAGTEAWGEDDAAPVAGAPLLREPTSSPLADIGSLALRLRLALAEASAAAAAHAEASAVVARTWSEPAALEAPAGPVVQPALIAPGDVPGEAEAEPALAVEADDATVASAELASSPAVEEAAELPPADDESWSLADELVWLAHASAAGSTNADLSAQLRSILDETARVEAERPSWDVDTALVQLRTRLGRLTDDRRRALGEELARVRDEASAMIAAAHSEASSIIARAWSSVAPSSVTLPPRTGDPASWSVAEDLALLASASPATDQAGATEPDPAADVSPVEDPFVVDDTFVGSATLLVGDVPWDFADDSPASAVEPSAAEPTVVVRPVDDDVRLDEAWAVDRAWAVGPEPATTLAVAAPPAAPAVAAAQPVPDDRSAVMASVDPQVFATAIAVAVAAALDARQPAPPAVVAVPTGYLPAQPVPARKKGFLANAWHADVVLSALAMIIVLVVLLAWMA